jgi:hypothetical protein
VGDFYLRPDLSKELFREKPVNFEFCGKDIIIRDAQSNAYCGLVGSNTTKGIVALRAECSVSLSAGIQSIAGSKTLSTIVYGHCEQSEQVGEILLDHECYLQRPDSFDASVPYQNPQSYSVSSITNELAVLPMPGQTGPSKSSVMSSVTKSKVAGLLDSASGPETFTEQKASDKLRTPLKM